MGSEPFEMADKEYVFSFFSMIFKMQTLAR